MLARIALHCTVVCACVHAHTHTRACTCTRVWSVWGVGTELLLWSLIVNEISVSDFWKGPVNQKYVNLCVIHSNTGGLTVWPRSPKARHHFSKHRKGMLRKQEASRDHELASIALHNYAPNTVLLLIIM